MSILKGLMNKKRIVFILFISLFLLVVLNVDIFALPIEGYEYDEISDYSNENTYFGKIKKESEDIMQKSRVTYHSNWARWQSDIKESYDHKKIILYRCESMLDIPFDIQWTERLEPGQYIKKEYEEEVSYEYSNTKINKESIRLFGEFSIGKSLGIKLPIDIFELTGIKTDNFKFGWEFANETVEKIEESKSIKYTEKRDYYYKNEYGEPIYYQKNYRQRYYVVILCGYEYIYEQSRFGSGMFGRDDNYSYKFKNYKCTKYQTYLIPIGNPYFQYSIYYDRGVKVNISNVDKVIFA